MKYKIKELSQLMNVSSNTIRRYEQLGYLSPERTDSGNYRYFSNADLSKTMFVRFFRKLNFTHPDILNILSQDLPSSISLCEQHLSQMDDEIKNLTKLRHLLKDYIQLMKTQPDYINSVYEKTAVPLYYTLFCSRDTIYNEPERLKIIQQYMYNAPETHMIYLFKKEDIINNIPAYQCGWAIKPKDMPGLDFENSPYTKYYPPVQILVTEVELPIDIENYINNIYDLRSSLLKNVYAYMNEHNYDIAGDIIGIRISLGTNNGKPVQYILLNIPVSKK